jgi:hypothetical protein
MKKAIIFTALIISISAVPRTAHSYFSAELTGTALKNTDSIYLFGGGGTLSYTINNHTGLIFKGYYTVKDDEQSAAGETVSLEYSYWSNMLGFEFYIPVDFLLDLRLKWKHSICAGFASFDLQAEHKLSSASLKDTGHLFYYSTGLQFLYNQHVAPFAEAAVFYSRFNESLSESNMNGYLFNAGIRYSFGPSRSITDGY